MQQSEAGSGGQRDEVQLEGPVRRPKKHAQVSFENGPESASSGDVAASEVRGLALCDPSIMHSIPSSSEAGSVIHAPSRSRERCSAMADDGAGSRRLGSPT